MKKYRFQVLHIEITRKCNLKCPHCMRGNAEDLTITPEIIDSFLSQVTEIGEIGISGGETMLELDTFEYLVKAIDKHNVKVRRISFVTNGTILNERAIQILSDFIAANSNRNAGFAISDDEFHSSREHAKEAYEFYSALANEKIEIVLNSERSKTNLKSDNVYKLFYSGMASHYIMGNHTFKGLPVVGRVAENSIRPHRIKIENNTIHCVLELSANGNLGFDASVSYGVADNLAFGNILQDSLHDILTRHNATCPYLCDETYNEMLCYNAAYMKDCIKNKNAIEEEGIKLRVKTRMKQFDLVWQLRKWALERYPNIGIEKIISCTVLDNDFFFEKVKALMVKRMPDEKLQFNPRVKRLAQLAPKEVLEYKMVYQFEKYYSNKYPEATEKQIHELSILNSMYKFVMSMTLDDLIEAVFDGNGAERYFENLDHWIKQTEFKTDGFDCCGLIPDTLTPRDDEPEEAENNESDTQE